jgi:hypothetical protein
MNEKLALRHTYKVRIFRLTFYLLCRLSAPNVMQVSLKSSWLEYWRYVYFNDEDIYPGINMSATGSYQTLEPVDQTWWRRTPEVRNPIIVINLS